MEGMMSTEQFKKFENVINISVPFLKSIAREIYQKVIYA